MLLKPYFNPYKSRVLFVEQMRKSADPAMVRGPTLCLHKVPLKFEYKNENTTQQRLKRKWTIQLIRWGEIPFGLNGKIKCFTYQL